MDEFRVWDIDNEYMEFFDLSNISKMILILDTYRNYFNDNYFLDIDEKTGYPLFMYYTGLKDINNKKIYVGDILKIPNPLKPKEYLITPVFFSNGCFSVTIVKEKGSDYLIEHIENAEIIGNVFQNYELLN